MDNFIINQPLSQAVNQTLSIFQQRKEQQESLLPHLIKAFKDTDFYSASKESRVRDCGSYLSISPQGKITAANFCKNKLCPICQWRLSRQMYGKIARMQGIVEKEHKEYQYIFLTLTLRNMARLDEGIQAILQGFKNLVRDRTFIKLNKGFIRALEVTYNGQKGTWHPHIHMILAVEPEYFKSGYLRKGQWALLWKRAARLSYTPIVDVRKVSDNHEKAIAEIAKYTVKPFNVKNANKDPSEIYSELLNSTYNRRLRSFSRIYKDAAKAVDLNDETMTEGEYNPRTDIEYTFINGEYKLHKYNAVDAKTGEHITMYANHETGEVKALYPALSNKAKQEYHESEGIA